MIATPTSNLWLFKSLAVLSMAAATLLAGTVANAQVPAAPPAVATSGGETLVTKRPASLREEPFESSRILQTLALQSQLTRIGDKQGAWIKVRLNDASQGWVHMFDVTSSTTATSGSTGAGMLRSVTSFLNRGSTPARNSNVATSTVGIRGLNAQDIANATPNTQALQQAESFRVDAGEAGRFASAASLMRQSVSALPQPEPSLAESKP